MATFKYRDKNGNFISMPAFKGDKGDQGIGILKVEQTTTSSESNGENIVTVTLTNGQKFNFSMRNGAKGDTGNHGGIQDVSASATEGYITVTNQDGTTKEVIVGAAGDFLPLSGGTMTGNIYMKHLGVYWKENNYGDQFAIFPSFGGVDDNNLLKIMGSVGEINTNPDLYDLVTISGKSGNVNVKGTVSAASVYGAVWNDYAEYRSQNEIIEPGYIAYCDDDGKLKKTTERLQKYEGVVSDTFGFAIGETDECKTPLAVSGRALVYCDPEEEHFHSGDCVCAGPDGLAYRMTREEIMKFPDRIVGIVSEIPTYETWGTGNVEVNGRIWIKVK